MSIDPISRWAVIDTLKELTVNGTNKGMISGEDAVHRIEMLPPAQLDKDKVSDLLHHIYSIQSPHLDMAGVIAKKYYCEELWKELFGEESELPGWMN